MSEDRPARGKLARQACGRCLAATVVLAGVLFGTAGTLAFWQAWLYLAVLVVPMCFVLAYLLGHAPELLVRRMRMREKEPRQRVIIGLAAVPYVLSILLPGVDRRLDWSHVPFATVLVAEVLVLASYGIIVRAFLENRFASRIVEVETGQAVIDTGPYAVVRHPMYLGAVLLYLFTPLALGSYWALIPAALLIPVIVARILNEEAVLGRDLDGYRAYMARTRYRLIPRVW